MKFLIPSLAVLAFALAGTTGCKSHAKAGCCGTDGKCCKQAKKCPADCDKPCCKKAKAE